MESLGLKIIVTVRVPLFPFSKTTTVFRISHCSTANSRLALNYFRFPHLFFPLYFKKKGSNEPSQPLTC